MNLKSDPLKSKLILEGRLISFFFENNEEYWDEAHMSIALLSSYISNSHEMKSPISNGKSYPCDLFSSFLKISAIIKSFEGDLIDSKFNPQVKFTQWVAPYFTSYLEIGSISSYSACIELVYYCEQICANLISEKSKDSFSMDIDTMNDELATNLAKIDDLFELGCALDEFEQFILEPLFNYCKLLQIMSYCPIPKSFMINLFLKRPKLIPTNVFDEFQRILKNSTSAL